MKPKSTLLFHLLSFIYRAVVTTRKFLYKTGVFKTNRLPIPVISVGNITVGGVGKTPAICDIAGRIERMEKKAVIISRGYGRKSREPILTASDGAGSVLPWEKIGDEPAMMGSILVKTPLVIGADRFRAGEVAMERFDPDVFLLDDAYQRLSIHRDLNILVIDATNPFGNRRMLPGGILRESIGNLDRADAYLLTRVDQAEDTDKLVSELKRFEKPIFRSVHRPTHLTNLGSGQKKGLETLVSGKGIAFSGIGAPSSFHKTLSSLNYTLVGKETFPDHYVYLPKDIKRLKQKMVEEKADYLITTEKDAIRLPGDCGKGIWSLGIRLEIVDDEDGWEKLIESRTS
jgi:tetraacyldisaccharide 4'-kinase